MIKIIRPRHFREHKARIGALLDLFTVYQNLNLSLEEKSKTDFFIAKDETQGVYGGALLRQQLLKSLDPKIRQLISSLSPTMRRVWVVNLCLPIGNEESFLTIKGFNLCEVFFQSLFKEFMKFGREAKIGFLVVKLLPRDDFKLKSYGYWPCLFEVSPKESLDGLFHEILSLKPARQINFKPLESERPEELEEQSR